MSLNFAEYCAILKTHMLPSAHALFHWGQNWMFHQDNAPGHTSRARRTWLQEHSIQVLEWPAQHLDMSPIENLWWIINRNVSKCKPKNLEELKAVIQEEWDKITPQQCEGLVGNMPANGRTTNLMMWFIYFLFSFEHILCYLLTLITTMLRIDILKLSRI